MARTFLQLTDTHIQAQPSERLGGMDTRRSFNAVLDLAANFQGDVAGLLLTGDLTQDGEEASYQWLAQRLRDQSHSAYCLPGNHDDVTVMRRYMSAQNISCPDLLELANWRIVLLDSVVAGHEHGELSNAELDRVEALAHDDDQRHLLIAMHHPPIKIDSRWMDAMGLRNANAFWDRLQGAPKLKTIVAGHVHQNLDSFCAGTRVLLTPSTCVQFAPRSIGFARDSRLPGLRALTLCDDGSVLTAVHRLSSA